VLEFSFQIKWNSQLAKEEWDGENWWFHEGKWAGAWTPQRRAGEVVILSKCYTPPAEARGTHRCHPARI
jgi:hypothetical protein